LLHVVHAFQVYERNTLIISAVGATRKRLSPVEFQTQLTEPAILMVIKGK